MVKFNTPESNMDLHLLGICAETLVMCQTSNKKSIVFDMKQICAILILIEVDDMFVHNMRPG